MPHGHARADLLAAGSPCSVCNRLAFALLEAYVRPTLQWPSADALILRVRRGACSSELARVVNAPTFALSLGRAAPVGCLTCSPLR